MKTLIPILLITCITAVLAGCSYAPGLSAGAALENATNSQPVLSNQDQPNEYVTDKGFIVIAKDVTADNIPALSYQQMNISKLNSLLRTQPKKYLLANGDVIALSLWAYPEITPQKSSNSAGLAGYTIDQNGYVNLPLVGRIKARGLSLDRLQRKLQSAYGKYLKTPDLTVSVVQYNAKKYYVYGEVKKPGQYNITDLPVNLMTAIGESGGMSSNANLHDIRLTRGHRTYHLSLPDIRKMGIQPTRVAIQENDILSIGNKELRKIFLLGEAKTPSSMIIPEQGMSLSYVIGKGKGLQSKTANASKIYVLRDNVSEKTTNIYRVDLSSFDNFAMANRFKMQKDDVVYIDATGLAKWNRVINLMLPSSTAIRSVQTIGD